ncbi:MAG: alpha/beta hydrolase [Burkholderiaceae bacterium]
MPSPPRASASPFPATIVTRDDLARVEAQSRRITTPCGDGDLVWHEWGAGEPVVLLHGGSGSWNHWVRNVPALVAAGRQVLVPDMPGFGDSAAAPGVVDADGLPPHLDTAIATLLGQRSFDLVGFSFGSLVATLLAERCGERVQRLVLVGPFIVGDGDIPPLDLRPWAHIERGPARDAIHRYNLGALMLANARSIDDLALAIHGANIERDRMRRRRLALTDLMAQTLPRIRRPVAAIWGTEDMSYRGRGHVAEKTVRLAPDCRVVAAIDGAGHWVQFEAPDAFDAALATALAMPTGAG